jgi:two-component system sensor histidine kinase KdpD
MWKRRSAGGPTFCLWMSWRTPTRRGRRAGRTKRWQDVEACLAAGVNVYTTLNVQHLESINDVVAQITGVRVNETVPDRVFDEADEIELVDLPPDALHERLKAGKVYLGEHAARAVDPSDGFFRKGNLTALRELALRRTAAWVDSDMRRYKQDRGIRAVWPAGERIVVAVSPSPCRASWCGPRSAWRRGCTPS